ncbi:OTU domain-containing protein DDB_G0284757-like isoform X2 [Cynara cardunculus var. scolymus]|uniref:OTU domain-containing protein DDB_G0284757-like isoform X2 n=1 Tax=Cynara cardunculus var. scolymus TaxID=59895 RepID=UPI000D625671|nr:OTU domain-containing protein DDB_G0284757-like isoform X2 [Cynara cardunculus var. scolymus]
MCEPDSDVVKWGLHFLDVDQIFSSTYYGDSNQQDMNICHEQYNGGGYQENEFNNVENDEMLAHSLQQELLDFSITDENEPSNVVQDHLQVSNPVEHLQTSSDTQDWYGPSSDNYYYGDESRLQETEEMGPSSACSSPGNRSYDGDEYSYNLEITDESELDGEVGKRLNEIVPVPHVPKVNGDIPSVDEATTDHQRLLDRLQLYNLIESKVQGDGNCQFRALSDQFYRSPEHHKFVRRQVVNQLKLHPEIYEGYVPMAYSDYLKRISKSGEWGDHVTLQAAADSYGVKIFVLTSFKDTCSIEILPKVQKSKRVIFLSFWAEVHYNSIYPEGELPPPEYRRKRRWWNFKHRHQAYLD